MSRWRTARLGQGLLTYALAVDGLGRRRGRPRRRLAASASTNGWPTRCDGCRRWPTIRASAASPRAGEGSRAITFNDLPANAPARRVQQPALFDFNPRPSTVVLRKDDAMTRALLAACLVAATVLGGCGPSPAPVPGAGRGEAPTTQRAPDTRRHPRADRRHRPLPLLRCAPAGRGVLRPARRGRRCIALQAGARRAVRRRCRRARARCLRFVERRDHHADRRLRDASTDPAKRSSNGSPRCAPATPCCSISPATARAIATTRRASQDTGYNGTILPTDARNPDGSPGDIFDVELKALKDRATAKGLFFVSVFDSCNSATATRDGAAGQSRSAPALVGAAPPAPAADIGWRRWLLGAPGGRAGRRGSAGNRRRSVGTRAGVFTTALLDTLRMPGMRDATFGDLIQEVRLRVAARGHAAQTPSAEGALSGGVRCAFAHGGAVTTSSRPVGDHAAGRHDQRHHPRLALRAVCQPGRCGRATGTRRDRVGHPCRRHAPRRCRSTPRRRARCRSDWSPRRSRISFPPMRSRSPSTCPRARHATPSTRRCVRPASPTVGAPAPPASSPRTDDPGADRVARRRRHVAGRVARQRRRSGVRRSPDRCPAQDRARAAVAGIAHQRRHRHRMPIRSRSRPASRPMATGPTACPPLQAGGVRRIGLGERITATVINRGTRPAYVYVLAIDPYNAVDVVLPKPGEFDQPLPPNQPYRRSGMSLRRARGLSLRGARQRDDRSAPTRSQQAGTGSARPRRLHVAARTPAVREQRRPARCRRHRGRRLVRAGLHRARTPEGSPHEPHLVSPVVDRPAVMRRCSPPATSVRTPSSPAPAVVLRPRSRWRRPAATDEMRSAPRAPRPGRRRPHRRRRTGTSRLGALAGARSCRRRSTTRPTAPTTRRSADGDTCKIYLAQRASYELAHKCGGAYIGDGWVATAAHCVDNIPGFDGNEGNVLTDRRMRLGTQNLTVDDGLFAIDAVVIHEALQEASETRRHRAGAGGRGSAHRGVRSQRTAGRGAADGRRRPRFRCRRGAARHRLGLDGPAQRDAMRSPAWTAQSSCSAIPPTCSS